jgi:hypothetical protein
MVNSSRHKTDAPTIPLVGNIDELHFQAIAKRTSDDIKLSDTNFVPNIFLICAITNPGGGIIEP